MKHHCDLSNPWINDDFVPCFRETIINGLLPIAIIASSFLVILLASIKHYKKTAQKKDSKYTPLLAGSENNTYYGAASSQQDTSSENTVVASNETSPCRWTVFTLSRIGFSALQVFLFAYGLKLLVHKKYTFSPSEGSASDILIAYSSRILFWAFSLILSLVNFKLSSVPNALADTICNHLNFLYLFDFFISVVDVRSYYLLEKGVDIGIGYKLSLWNCALDLVLLTIIINEARTAPSSPVITEEGRTLSGENWASIYSQFMFSWVNVMMKEGYKRTLNDIDLIELPKKNRSKNTLFTYRKKQVSPSLVGSLIRLFSVDLTVQTFYCVGWSLLIFGPPYFLNKIVKYIENSNGEPVLTAFLYVTGLFITNCAQSLSLQQALYIGRSIGIRIQSVVIGEVFSKSLRRRDQSGGAKDGEGNPAAVLDEDKKTDKKSNVNNLLSVDAQKIAEVAAYIFYIYSYPIQIVISIWSLYELLGNAALWGVLVMIITQPITYWLSIKFQTSHETVMSATDKRLKAMNELLSAIRIVKFFAWEKEFKKRVSDARGSELTSIRSRLMMFMWMGCAWFFIPVLIMVTVFYTYTLSNALTASVAFTALALFNTFRGALDEFPFVISMMLQANVSVKRIESFMEEDEVELPTTAIHHDASSNTSTAIGFANNATFSWDKPSKEGGNVTPGKANLKNLNLSFPVGKLSIVCGPTGSGKTTLISSLLGETYCLTGQAILPRIIPNQTSRLGGAVSGIAYVAQTAWLQNCSIRDNILFGLPYDEERYESVLYMTALTRDLDILEFGDETEVGEKGITLSGGQKQRVAIARAIYSQANTIILDDCLSAVDAHTAKHLYDKCLMGPLMNTRTIILVTHYVALCMGGADYIVALKEGEVLGSGSPADMLKSGALGEELSRSKNAKLDSSEEEAVEGAIPTVPKTMAKKANNGGGKLVQEEERAEGGVSWSVYQTYIKASGGPFVWAAILFLFSLAQAVFLGQDYWIKVWSAAYGNVAGDVNGTINSESYNGFSTAHTTVSAIGSSVGYYVNVVTSCAETAVSSMNLKTPESVDLNYYLGIYFLIGVVGLFMMCFRSLVLFAASLGGSRNIHDQLLTSILRAKVRFFDTTPLGRIVNRFSSDMETIDQAVGLHFSFLLQSIIATICVIILVSAVTPAFLVPGVFITILFCIIGAYYLATSRDMKRLNSVSRSPIYVQFNESVNGVVTIRAFGCQQRFINENYTKIDNNNRPFLWLWATNRWLHCRVDILGAFVGFCTGFVLVLGRGWVDPGLAGLSLSYALMFTHHVLWVVRNYAMNEMNMNAIERVREYLDIEQEPPAHIPETMPSISWPETGSIEVKDLVVQYAPENPAVLRNISFKVNPREKIGVVGRTGSGKSTLALSIFRFMEPTSGSIKIDGVDIHSIGLNDLRSRLTIIPQDPILFSGTLRSNLDPFDQHSDLELWAALKRSHLIDEENEQQEGEEKITLESPVAENGSNWSQGQRQLIALARALVKRTGLIILDEATSSVDFDTDRKIQETIRSEFKNSALLCVAHRLRTIADYDRVLVLDQGEVVEFDTPFNLMTLDGSVFQQMCVRSGEFDELLDIAKHKKSPV